MRNLFILLQIPSDPGQKITVQESADRSGFLSLMDAAEQEGGPEGIERLILVSTDGFCRSRSVWPKSWHKDQAEAERKRAADSKVGSLVAQLPELLDRWDADTEALGTLHAQIAELDPEAATKLQPETKLAALLPPPPTEDTEKLAALRQSLVDAGLDPEKDLKSQLAELAAPKAPEGSQDAGDGKPSGDPAPAGDLLGGQTNPPSTPNGKNKK